MNLNERKRKARAFWWGRTYPDEYKHLVGISNPNNDQLEQMETLKGIFQKAEYDGINLGWGHYTKKKEVYAWHLKSDYK